METGTRVRKPVDYSDYYTGDEIDQAFIDYGIDPAILAQDDENMEYLNLNSGNFLLTECYFEVDGEEYHVTAEPTDVEGDYYIVNFLNDLNVGQFMELWRDEESKTAIAALMRHPGHMHEWLMIAALPTLKRMGIDFNRVKDVRTEITTDFQFVSEGQKWTHGANRGSALMHIYLKKKIEDQAQRYEEDCDKALEELSEEPNPLEYLQRALRDVRYTFFTNPNPGPNDGVDVAVPKALDDFINAEI